MVKWLNGHCEAKPKQSLLLLTTYCLLLTTHLDAVEGNEPVPEIELPTPEVKEETLKITTPYKFPCLSLGLEGGKNELGKIYEVKLNSSPRINESFAVRGLKIEDKTSLIGEAEKRFISSHSIAEIDAQAGAYKISESLNEFGIINSATSLYLGENVFKLLGSGCYENVGTDYNLSLLWDFGILWGRNLWESIFVGAGVSGPRYITLLLQINWIVNPALSINISHRSKEVTTTFDSLYMNQPYVIQNPELKHERWYSLSTVKFLFQNNTTVEITHKWVENIIWWSHLEIYDHNNTYLGRRAIPLNGGKLPKLEGKVDFTWKKLKNASSVEYIFLKEPKSPHGYYIGDFLPTILFVNTLETSLPSHIEIELESKYIEKKFCLGDWNWGDLSDYWLFAFKLSKKLKNWEIWGRVNNLTNTKYDIIKGVEGPGTSFQVGIEFNL